MPSIDTANAVSPGIKEGVIIFFGNKFSSKTIEKMLFLAGGRELKRDKRTRAFVRETAKNVEEAYKHGLRDGQNGEPLVEKSQLMGADVSATSELLQSILNFAYEAYRAGHVAGSAKRGERI